MLIIIGKRAREVTNMRLKGKKEKIIKRLKFFCPKDTAVKLKNKECVLIISHSDYMGTIGGVEKFLKKRTTDYIREGKTIISISPYYRRTYWSRMRNVYCLYIDNEYMGSTSLRTLLYFLEEVDIATTEVHHVLYYPLKDLVCLTEFIYKKKRYSVFVHDELFLNIEYIYNFMTPKLKSDIYEQAFENCTKGLLMNAVFIEVPSHYYRDCVIEKLGCAKEFVHCTSPIVLKVKSISSEKHHRQAKLRIAYLGYQADNKGYQTWERIAKNKVIISKYELFHIGKWEKMLSGVKYISYGEKDSSYENSIEALKSNNIDIVLQWSIVAESFSYTFHEALLAGAFVFTSALSGNIAYEIKKLYKYNGNVFDNEDEVIDALISMHNNQEWKEKMLVYEQCGENS